MNKSLTIDFEKERKEIMKINSKYNPAEISSKFANIVSGVDSMVKKKILSKKSLMLKRRQCMNSH